LKFPSWFKIAQEKEWEIPSPAVLFGTSSGLIVVMIFFCYVCRTIPKKISAEVFEYNLAAVELQKLIDEVSKEMAEGNNNESTIGLAKMASQKGNQISII
jgi:hypothetical protein